MPFLQKKGCCGTAAVENGIFSKINPTLIPKIQMKSKRSKSSPKWKTRHKELHSRQGIFITQISRPAVSKWAHLQKYHQKWGSVELLYFPLCIYNGVKSFIVALNFYVPPRPNKRRGLCPTKSALLKQVKKFPGNDMYLNWSSEQKVLLVFIEYPYNRLSLWFKSLTYQCKLLLQNVRRVHSNAMFVEKY